jgi:hypothetical protein
MVKKKSGNKKVLGKVSVPKGTVYGFSPKRKGSRRKK